MHGGFAIHRFKCEVRVRGVEHGSAKDRDALGLITDGDVTGEQGLGSDRRLRAEPHSCVYVRDTTAVCK